MKTIKYILKFIVKDVRMVVIYTMYNISDSYRKKVYDAMDELMKFEENGRRL